MQIAARTGAWAKSGYTAKDYVQDGLVAMWDGIENAGWGVHDVNATVWKDLVGSNDVVILSGAYGEFFENNYTTRPSGGQLPCIGFIKNKYFVIAHAESVSSSFEGTAHGFSVFQQHKNRNIGNVDNNIFMHVLKGDRIGTSKTDTGIFHGAFLEIGNDVPTAISSDYDYSDLTTKSLFVNGEENQVAEVSGMSNAAGPFAIGGRRQGIEYNASFNGRVYCLRLYDRWLSPAEIAANYAVDKARFNLT